jgi:serine/threonine protein kinase
MSEPAKPHTPPPAALDGTTPVMRGLEAEVSTSPSPVGETPTLIGGTAFALVQSLVGQTFGDFELRAELGRGGMGVVYKAWQKSLERWVALKLLLAEHACNNELLSRFLAEGRAAAGLTHPNIVSVYQVGECVAGPYFVMEFIDGPSLESLLQRTLPITWSMSLLITVAEAVQHAHEKGIVHRDLKPANIMLHQSKRPVVMDFGIAKVLGKGAGVTRPGVPVGTPAYMPPEQAGEQPEKIGPHSDVYALGAILYHLLAGKPPFEESSAIRTIVRVLSADPPEPIRLFRPEVPSRLEQLCSKCLEKDPARRYASAQALADDLKRLRATQMSRAAVPSAPRPTLPSVSLVGPNGKRMQLTGASTTIGRSPECDLVIKVSDVSKRHCRILLAPGEVAVEDLGSSNGTFVNGEQVDRRRLEDGDKLELGGHLLKVRVEKTGSKMRGSHE